MSAGRFTEFSPDMSFKYALCSEVFSTPLDETIASIAEAGFDGIEIAPFNAGESVEDVGTGERALLRNEPGIRRPQWLGLLERELFRGKRADNTNRHPARVEPAIFRSRDSTLGSED